MLLKYESNIDKYCDIQKSSVVSFGYIFRTKFPKNILKRDNICFVLRCDAGNFDRTISDVTYEFINTIVLFVQYILQVDYFLRKYYKHILPFCDPITLTVSMRLSEQNRGPNKIQENIFADKGS